MDEMLNFKIVVPVMVAIIFSYGFIRLGEEAHRYFNESDDCEMARSFGENTNFSTYDDYLSRKEVIGAYSTYYNAYCKYPFEFPRG